MLAIAEVQKNFGTKGELIIRLRPEAPEEINLNEPVFITIEDLPVPFYFKSFDPHGTRRAKVVFDDMETAELAAELIGKTIEMKVAEEKRQTNAQPSLLHYKVVDKKKGTVGVVTGFLDIPGNPCLLLNHNGREIIIPFQEAIIKKIDVKKQVLEVALPEGLLELQ